ncbi:HU family DNA-binding protein [Metabacillus fastidiosus]|uniref:HU family DNA-binding protein n=1 Tax=Metabacillus fastidiosus TaxID=1458 RepID=UPI003D2BCBC1
MKKSELEVKVFEGLTEAGFEFNKKQSDQIADKVFEVVYDLVVAGEEVPVGKLGKIGTTTRKARKGVNPTLLGQLKEQGVDPEQAKIQAQIDIAASVAPKYKPSKTIKDALNSK